MAVVTLQDQLSIATDTSCINCWMPAQENHTTHAGQEEKSIQIL